MRIMSAIKFQVVFLAVLSAFSFVLADAVILEFRAEILSNQIKLVWKTQEENNVKKFVIERSVNDRDFISIGELNAKGSNSQYEFIDSNLGELLTVYYYRLKIVNEDNTYQFSDSLPVIPNISNVKRTWGSIKALFR